MTNQEMMETLDDGTLNDFKVHAEENNRTGFQRQIGKVEYRLSQLVGNVPRV